MVQLRGAAGPIHLIHWTAQPGSRGNPGGPFAVTTTRIEAIRLSSDKAHWQRKYEERPPDEVSWYERIPETSLALIAASGVGRDAAILDVGGGASHLSGALLRAGYTEITVADLSTAALDRARSDLGDDADRVAWVEADIRIHDFGRQFDLWHDRAAFHFMVETDDREGYLEVLRRTLRPGGHLILATFGPEGPTRCSGLPVHRYGEAELSDEFGATFDLVSSQEVKHQTPSGAGQQFIYAHFQRKADP